jgi:sporulation protein YlmC with PRC-barrel domain
MNRCWISLAVVLAAFFVAMPAAIAAAPGNASNQSLVQGSSGITQISNLMGTTVVNLQGQKVGPIKDVLLDAQTGQATFVILDTVVPDSGHAMLVVPYPALRISSDPATSRSVVILDLRQEQLHAAPRISSGEEKLLHNPQFLEQARVFYGPITYTVARPIDDATPPPCPQTANAESGWPQNLIDLFNE